MILDSIRISSYELRFRKEYINAKFKLSNRKGWIIQLSSGGFAGYGDCSPLEKFSLETLDQCAYALEGFKLSIDSNYDIDLDELLYLSKVHGENLPSVQFAIDCAIYDLYSQLNQVQFNKYLNKNAYSNISVAHYPNCINQSFDGMVLKIKIINDNLFKNLDYIDSILDNYKCNIRLRLDCNGSLSLDRAIRFCKMLDGKSIDYIEQPLNMQSYEDIYELSMHTDIPIAIDEVIVDIESIEKLLENSIGDVFILKPMLIGNIDKLKKMTELLLNEEKRFNISSLLESNIGRLAYVHLASALNIQEECGIATNVFFENDLCNFPKSKNGIISFDNQFGLGINEINI